MSCCGDREKGEAALEEQWDYVVCLRDEDCRREGALRTDTMTRTWTTSRPDRVGQALPTFGFGAAYSPHSRCMAWTPSSQ